MDDYLQQRDAFVRRLKNEARSGLSKSFISFLIHFYNSNERYISELEFENMRLHKKLENNNDIEDYLFENIGVIQSLLIKELKVLNNDIGRYNRSK